VIVAELGVSPELAQSPTRFTRFERHRSGVDMHNDAVVKVRPVLASAVSTGAFW
jgi:hypothetical protein